ncbi:MAG: 2-amino-4-hydroxy-6-hydroxymethyldihydropteridine diphosphokinase [Candidatus Gastranaerophilales bacterium]|nr:2-amino-4-hydroxy-6-hydroxymethyldihydropteridine diphosphokinase [Candidatus Gastranaerophilales bacterium]MCM1073919.1 2-amino-4-hydroxy-6-hydroxymethyldihydropteridine diphosphokinase [Bacteroides sp.]
MAIVYLSLGSNIGDRVGFIQQATSLLSSNENINIVSTSSFYESEPWQMDSDNWFVNAVIQISTTLMPETLLTECQKIETFLGRKRQAENPNYTDRTIDIDIICYDNQILNTPELTIPHKYFHKRAFVLVPMLEIAEDFVHPVLGKTVEELFEDIENPEMVCLYGTRI